MEFIYHKGLKRDEWSEQKLSSVKHQLPNTIVSDIGAGWGYFKKNVDKHNLIWQPFDYVDKIPEAQKWDLNHPAPKEADSPGYVNFLEVYEHLANPELGIKNISNHLVKGGYLALSCPNPLYVKSKFTMIFKDRLYAFQPKHLVEYHVNIPFPHIIEFYLENHGFKILEKAIIGEHYKPKLKLSVNGFKDWVKFVLEKMLGGTSIMSKGHTQVYFAVKQY